MKGVELAWNVARVKPLKGPVVPVRIRLFFQRNEDSLDDPIDSICWVDFDDVVAGWIRMERMTVPMWIDRTNSSASPAKAKASKPIDSFKGMEIPSMTDRLRARSGWIGLAGLGRYGLE